MEFLIKIRIDKDKMNQDGKSINDFDFKGLKAVVENVEYVEVQSITSKPL